MSREYAGIISRVNEGSLAEELEPSGTQSLDPDELLTWETRPVPEVLNAWGSPEFCHGLMGTALAFYLLRRQEEGAP